MVHMGIVVVAEGGLVRRICTLILALAMLANGCGRVHVVDSDAPGGVLRELNFSAYGKLVRVELVSGQKFSGTGIHAASDSTTWFDPGDRRVAVATADIARVDVISRQTRNRAWMGALIGSIPGGIMLVGALREGPSDTGLEYIFGPVFIIGGALLGAGLGLLFEREEETTTTYILSGRSAGFYLEETP